VAVRLVLNEGVEYQHAWLLADSNEHVDTLLNWARLTSHDPRHWVRGWDYLQNFGTSIGYGYTELGGQVGETTVVRRIDLTNCFLETQSGSPATTVVAVDWAQRYLQNGLWDAQGGLKVQGQAVSDYYALAAGGVTGSWAESFRVGWYTGGAYKPDVWTKEIHANSALRFSDTYGTGGTDQMAIWLAGTTNNELRFGASGASADYVLISAAGDMKFVGSNAVYMDSDKVLGARQTFAYTEDGEGSAYTGLDNAQAGTPYAALADLNQLRAAYEVLRAGFSALLTALGTSGHGLISVTA
jgi:hypothetical protein